MAPSKIMVSRHGEKPVKGGALGVRGRGTADERSVTTQGWARPDAPARHFDPLDARFAARHDPNGREPSRRCVETVKPLARLMGLNIDKRLTKEKDEEPALAKALLERSGVVLICWAHECIPALVRQLPHSPATSDVWPDDRFDVIWILDRLDDAGWRFTQAPQMLAAGDRRDPIAMPEAHKRP